ncbi:helix-turn-helix transcriptional regulator [Nitrospirillum sp. BR 11163]|uniref:helix-turn-helix transcriptional regulator n=1 Tax=Nitrospirillum sp. BR 11163 TaxID=3104323 RepID=UPI002AFE12A0|nr:helix-turn-helix transcriptional regulator [Nitrospirillum sp. BR 11163]MEA1674075.1 helix-turn-helix transcriptional regulator [Nitrospirillum sp. BR 11163]
MRGMKTYPPNRIRELRMARNLSQEDLAGLLETSSGQIHKLERSKSTLSLEWMLRIAEVLHCDPRDLIPPGERTAEAARDLLLGKVGQLQRLVKDGHFKAASAYAGDLAKELAATHKRFAD